MATTYKVLGQVCPPANTATPLYTVPSATTAIISTVVVCNQSTSATFRIAVQPAGISVAAKHYIAYDTVVAANDSISLTIGMTLAATDVVSVTANTTTVSFNAFGTELT